MTDQRVFTVKGAQAPSPFLVPSAPKEKFLHHLSQLHLLIENNEYNHEKGMS
jgi:hypothetical protein